MAPASSFVGRSESAAFFLAAGSPAGSIHVRLLSVDPYPGCYKERIPRMLRFLDLFNDTIGVLLFAITFIFSFIELRLYNVKETMRGGGQS